MGKLFVVYKVYVEEPVGQIDTVCSALEQVKAAEFKDLKKEPVGFGINVIKAGYLLPEKQDELLEKLEKEIKEIPGVKEIENEVMTLV